MPFASKRTLRCCLADQADFSICISREQRLLAGRDGPEKNERRKRERDRVCCLYRNRLGRAKARLRAAEFDDVGRGGERTATPNRKRWKLGQPNCIDDSVDARLPSHSSNRVDRFCSCFSSMSTWCCFQCIPLRSSTIGRAFVLRARRGILLMRLCWSTY